MSDEQSNSIGLLLFITSTMLNISAYFKMTPERMHMLTMAFAILLSLTTTIFYIIRGYIMLSDHRERRRYQKYRKNNNHE